MNRKTFFEEHVLTCTPCTKFFKENPLTKDDQENIDLEGYSLNTIFVCERAEKYLKHLDIKDEYRKYKFLNPVLKNGKLYLHIGGKEIPLKEGVNDTFEVLYNQIFNGYYIYPFSRFLPTIIDIGKNIKVQDILEQFNERFYEIEVLVKPLYHRVYTNTQIFKYIYTLNLWVEEYNYLIINLNDQGYLTRDCNKFKNKFELLLSIYLLLNNIFGHKSEDELIKITLHELKIFFESFQKKEVIDFPFD